MVVYTASYKGSRMKPATVIAVVNQKGGVGKTTTAVNLAASVAAAERRTLLVDLDPQGNASSGVGVSPRPSRTASTTRSSAGPRCATSCSQTELPTLKLVPSKQDLVAVEVELVDDPDRPYKLRAALASCSRASRSSTCSSTARRRSASSP